MNFIDQNVFDTHRQDQISLTVEKEKLIHKLNSLTALIALVENTDIKKFERILIGAGVAGTLVYEADEKLSEDDCKALVNVIIKLRSENYQPSTTCLTGIGCKSIKKFIPRTGIFCYS